MAHKKGQGSSRNGRDSNGQRRGVKVYGGQLIPAGGIIVRQVGMVFKPGLNTRAGKDCTIFSTVEGIVQFATRQRINVVASEVASN